MGTHTQKRSVDRCHRSQRGQAERPVRDRVTRLAWVLSRPDRGLGAAGSHRFDRAHRRRRARNAVTRRERDVRTATGPLRTGRRCSTRLTPATPRGARSTPHPATPPAGWGSGGVGRRRLSGTDQSGEDGYERPGRTPSRSARAHPPHAPAGRGFHRQRWNHRCETVVGRRLSARRTRSAARSTAEQQCPAGAAAALPARVTPLSRWNCGVKRPPCRVNGGVVAQAARHRPARLAVAIGAATALPPAGPRPAVTTTIMTCYCNIPGICQPVATVASS